jgi:hypothetical protein
MHPWKCPACGTLVPYDDYNRVLFSDAQRPYRCLKCAIRLAIDRDSDNLIFAGPKPDEPPKRR